MREVAVMIPALLLASVVATQPQVQASPGDALSTILAAFRTHPVVAIDDPHGDEAAHAFRMSLVRDHRFASIVDDIVVEFGNARYQHVIDRFTGGLPVEEAELRRVWQDTTQAHAIWDRPIYRRFFQTVRDVNAALQGAARVRVLLGDPPIDWNAVRTPEERRRWLDVGRSRHAAEIVATEVIGKGRRALVIYGAMHLMRNNLQGPNFSDDVARRTGVRPFVVLTHPSGNLEVLGLDPSGAPIPSVTLTAGTRLEGQMDAILYLGPKATRWTSRLEPSLCEDAEYRRMRAARMRLAGFSSADASLTRECQERPDFSGVWKPADEDLPAAVPRAGGPPPPPRTLLLTMAQTAAAMKMERRVETGGRETVYPFEYRLDGSESVNQMGPLVHRTTAGWTDRRLILTSLVFLDDRQLGVITEVYAFEGATLVVESKRKVPAGTLTSRIVYRRAPAK